MTDHRPDKNRSRIIFAIVVILVIAVAAFIVVRMIYHPSAATPTTSPQGPTTWVADDLKATGTGPSKRWYVECEDAAAPDDNEREIHVWVTDAQRKAHYKGARCPVGDIKAYGKKVQAREVG